MPAECLISFIKHLAHIAIEAAPVAFAQVAPVKGDVIARADLFGMSEPVFF